jgi:hypothetical protein
VLKNCGATNVAPNQDDRQLFLRRGDSISKHVHVYERIKILVLHLEETVLAKTSSNLTDLPTTIKLVSFKEVSRR